MGIWAVALEREAGRFISRGNGDFPKLDGVVMCRDFAIACLRTELVIRQRLFVSRDGLFGSGNAVTSGDNTVFSHLHSPREPGN